MSNEAMLICGAIFGIAVPVAALSSIRNSVARAKLAAMQDLMDTVIRNISFRYEREGELLPPDVDKAINDLHARMRAVTDIRKKPEIYRAYAGELASAMSRACVDRGFEIATEWAEPRDGKQRIDMAPEAWRLLRMVADRGFHRMMPNASHFPFERELKSEAEAELVEAAIEKLEYEIGHSRSDPEYSDSLARNLLIWQRWPKRNAS